MYIKARRFASFQLNFSRELSQLSLVKLFNFGHKQNLAAFYTSSQSVHTISNLKPMQKKAVESAASTTAHSKDWKLEMSPCAKSGWNNFNCVKHKVFSVEKKIRKEMYVQIEVFAEK